MSRVYVGNVDPRTTERELEDEFRSFGVLRSVWVARKPPGYAFIEFDDRRDAEDAIRALNGKNGWRVELSYSSGGGGSRGGRGRGRGSSDLKCYECGESGHFARECRSGNTFRGSGRGRRHNPSPRYRRSPSPRYRRSPDYGRSRDHSPPRHSISPRQVSISPRQRRDYSKSPPQRDGYVSPYANGSPVGRDRRRSQS